MNITVYLGSASGNHPGYAQEVIKLGTWIGKSGHRLIYGGCRIGRFVTVGPLSRNIDAGILETRADADVRHFDSVDELLPELPSLIAEGDAVLVKASHFMKFSRIVEELKNNF